MTKRTTPEPAEPPSVYVYAFRGLVPEHFGYLPADPPSQWLNPGDEVACSEPVVHDRLELLDATVAQPRVITVPEPTPEPTEADGPEDPTLPAPEGPADETSQPPEATEGDEVSDSLQ